MNLWNIFETVINFFMGALVFKTGKDVIAKETSSFFTYSAINIDG